MPKIEYALISGTNLTEIPNFAFGQQRNLKDLRINSNKYLNSIGAAPFEFCTV